MKKFLFLAMLMLQASFAFADDNTLEVVKFSQPAGTGFLTDTKLSYEDFTTVNLYNTDEDTFTGVQFDIHVPSGMVLDFDGESERSYFEKKGTKITWHHVSDMTDVKKSDRYENYDVYTVWIVDDNDNHEFVGTSGQSILNMYYGIPKDLKGGEYPIYLTHVQLIYEDATHFDIDEIQCSFTVEGTNAISNVETLSSKNVYDLQGRRTNAKNGVLLVNGQKQIVK